MAWVPALVLALSGHDGRVWLAMGLGALGGGCAAIAWLAQPVPEERSMPAAPCEAAPPGPPAGPATPPPERSVPPEVAAWVAAAREAMRPRVPVRSAAVRGEPLAPAAPRPAARLLAPPGGPGGRGDSVDTRLSRLAARQRAHTSDLRRSIRSALERQERAESA
ncbi:MAG TPA: hypothetical protein VKZ60_03145 [Chloroflexota bacterium]|jgi:hypothetical protein|nr:hypothetical protein [Chloroflexota bacterium]